MGKMETFSKERARKENIQKMILSAVSAAGILSIALLAPNALRIIPRRHLLSRDRRPEVIKRARQKLIENRLLAYKDNHVCLTPKGEAKLRQLELHEFKMKKPKKWDGKWRILIFDISEQRRLTRDKIRQTLRKIGFARLQQSVWVYPYDCEDLIALLKLDFKVGKDLLYLIVDNIENDAWLMRYFELKN